MEIIINNGKKDVMLRGEDGNFEICEQKSVKIKGASTLQWFPEGYYSTLAGALSRLWEVKVSNSDAKSIEELQLEIKKVRKEITDIYGFNL